MYHVSVAGACLGDLEIEGYALTIDQYGSGVQELLASAIVLLVAAQRCERKVEFHGFGCGGGGFAGKMDRRTEADPVKLLLILEISQQRTNKMGHVVIESHGCQLVPRARGSRGQGGIEGEFKIDFLTESHEFGRGVGHEVDLRVQLFHQLIEYWLVGSLQGRQGCWGGVARWRLFWLGHTRRSCSSARHGCPTVSAGDNFG